MERGVLSAEQHQEVTIRSDNYHHDPKPEAEVRNYAAF
jgi:hypothetical protein